MAKITYNLNGGSLLGKEVKFTFEAKTGHYDVVVLPLCDKEGYVFTGWYNEKGERILAVYKNETVEAHFVEIKGIDEKSGKAYQYCGRCPQNKIEITDDVILEALKSANYRKYFNHVVKYQHKAFFTIDPIKWIILGEEEDNYLAIAEKVLDIRQYDQYRYMNDQFNAEKDQLQGLSNAEKVKQVVEIVSKGSDARLSLLNEDVYMFSNKDKERMAKSIERGNDPIFILEVKDFENPKFFKETQLAGPAPSRVAYPTDYALNCATINAVCYATLGVDGSTWYWTSSSMLKWKTVVLKKNAFGLTNEQLDKVAAKLPGNTAHHNYSNAMVVGEDPDKENDLAYYIDFMWDAKKQENTGSISYIFKDYHFGGVRPGILFKK